MSQHKKVTLAVPPEVREFLLRAAEEAGVEPAYILERALSSRPLTSYAAASSFVVNMAPEAIQVLEEIDRLLRTANPGSQLVFRAGYVGYRRFDSRQPAGVKASRSQIYASVIPRRNFVRILVPVDEPNCNESLVVRDLSGKGHHGVGDTAIDMHSVSDAGQVMSVFGDWLGPSRG
jgi:predicted transport protein